MAREDFGVFGAGGAVEGGGPVCVVDDDAGARREASEAAVVPAVDGVEVEGVSRRDDVGRIAVVDEDEGV